MFHNLPPIPAPAKTFVLDSCDEHISTVLKQKGWKQAPKGTGQYNLKWTWKAQPKDYENMVNNQMINHFKNSQQLTTKLGMCLMYKKNPWIMDSGRSYQSFYPRSYNLSSEKDEFVKDYQHTGILNLLKKIIVCLQLYHNEQHFKAKTCQSLIRSKGTNAIIKQLLQQQTIFNSRKDPKNFKINGKYFLRLLFYMENIFSLDQSYDMSAGEIAELSRYGEQQVPFAAKNKQLEVEPCSQALAVLFYYHQKCLKQITGFYEDGFSNIWVVKSNHSSRARNISLIGSLIDLQNLDNGMKLVQKYVENIWVLHGLTEEQRKAYPFMGKLVKKKFDIRIWVLVKSFSPLCAYVYDQAYLRISSDSYRLDQLGHQESHLTNYSVNWKCKRGLPAEEQSYVLFSQFLQYLSKEEGVPEKHIKNSIDQAILYTLRCADIPEDPKCFELFGFDIILDADLKPWVLQCNMSPACSPRGELRTLVKKMSEGMLTLVGLIDGEKHAWRPLSDQKEKRNSKNLFQSRVLKQIKTETNRFNKTSFNLIGFNDLSLIAKKVDWRSCYFAQSVHFYIEKVKLIQNVWREKVRNRSQSTTNDQLKPDYKIGCSLRLIQVLAQIVKKNKKYIFSKLMNIKKARKHRRN